MAAQFRGTLTTPPDTHPNTATAASERAGEGRGSEDNQEKMTLGESTKGCHDNILQETAPTIKRSLPSTSETAGGREEGSVGREMEAGREEDREAAAQRIQEWYRHKKRQEYGVEVERLLREKREELDNSRSEQLKTSQREVYTTLHCTCTHAVYDTLYIFYNMHGAVRPLYFRRRVGNRRRRQGGSGERKRCVQLDKQLSRTYISKERREGGRERGLHKRKL